MYLKAILIGVAVATSPAPPQGQVQRGARTMECRMPDCVMVHGGDFTELLAANERAWGRVTELENELKRERADKTKRCGVLEVLPQRKTSL